MNALLPIRNRHRVRRGFSLVEVLLAILILGIGIISIAALFPAGIAQQRLANDDVMGPIVANNAISIIRSKVRQEDFGTFEEYQQDFPPAWNSPGDVPQAFFSRTLPGDWDWMRPGFLLQDDPETLFNENGAIDIFSHRLTRQRRSQWPDPDINVATEFPRGWPVPQYWSAMTGLPADIPLYGIPFNTELYFDSNILLPDPPSFIISQRERYYPMQTGLVNNDDAPRPQYVWDCMFRRYQGRVYVAIFVYRVSANNPAAQYIVQADEVNPGVPPIPYRINFLQSDDYAGARDVWYDDYDRSTRFILGSENVSSLNDIDPDSHVEAWQRTRQWLLDQNNNIHRVVGIEHDDDENAIRVELLRPLQPVMTGRIGGEMNDTTDVDDQWSGTPFANVTLPSDAPNYYFADAEFQWDDRVPLWHTHTGVVTDLWYIPRHVEVDGVEFTLTPIFVTVKEL